jgi:hypothetical protein
MNYKEHFEQRIKDLEKLKDYYPELIGQLDSAIECINQQIDASTSFDSIITKFEEMLGREVHPADVDALLPIITNYLMERGIKSGEIKIEFGDDMFSMLMNAEKTVTSMMSQLTDVLIKEFGIEDSEAVKESMTKTVMSTMRMPGLS